MSKESIPQRPDIDLNCGFTISHKFEQNRFLKSSDIHRLKREDGSVIETRFVTKIPYNKGEYIVVVGQSSDCFGDYIILKINNENKKISYSPVEDDKTLIALVQKFDRRTKIDDEEGLTQAIDSAKKNGFSFNMNFEIRE